MVVARGHRGASLRAGRANVVALAALALLALVFGPPLAQGTSHLLGLEYVDHYGTQWFYAYAERQLLSGEGFGWTNLFFFPWGKDVFHHTGSNVLDAIAAVPFRRALGATLGYNVFVLGGLLVSGAAMGGLVRARTRDPGAAWLAGALVAAGPYTLVELAEGRPTQAILLLPVLFVGALLRTGEREGVGHAALAGLLLAACGYQYWYYALFGGILALGHGLARILAAPPGAGARAQVLGRHVVVALVALAAALPVAKDLLTQAQAGTNVPGLLDTEAWTLSETVPVTRDAVKVGLMLWQPFVDRAGFYLADPGGREAFLPRAPMLAWAALPLVLAGAWLQTRAAGRRTLPRVVTVLMLLATVGIAVGPVIVLPGGWTLPNPPYIALAKSIGVLQRLWWPGRAHAFVAIVLALAAGEGLAALRRSFGGRVARAVGVLALAGLGAQLAAFQLAPFPSWDASVPAGYRCLAGRLPHEAAGTPGALIELPYSWNQAHLHFQQVHGRPILGGMLENNPTFTPAESVTFREDNTFVRALLDVATLQVGELPDWDDADREAVHALGYRYVVLQKDALVGGPQDGLQSASTRARMRAIRMALTDMVGPPIYDDARIAIHAPWGDPSPCASAPPAPDPTPRSTGEVTSADLLPQDPEGTALQRVWTHAAGEGTATKAVGTGGSTDAATATEGIDPATTSPQGARDVDAR